MNPERHEILLFLSAPPEISRKELRAVIAENTEARVTVYLRSQHRPEYDDLLGNCFVYCDKPARGRKSFVRELRAHLYHEAIVLDYGHWSYCPARCLFFLARAGKKNVRTERGTFEFSLLRPVTLLRHLLYRRKHRSGSVAGVPAGTPAPFLVAAYRGTIGQVVGSMLGMLEYSWRLVRR